jgi:hypothetical protein
MHTGEFGGKILEKEATWKSEDWMKGENIRMVLKEILWEGSVSRHGQVAGFY